MDEVFGEYVVSVFEGNQGALTQEMKPIKDLVNLCSMDCKDCAYVAPRLSLAP